MTEQEKTYTYEVLIQGGSIKINATTYNINDQGVLEFGVREGGFLRPVASFASWRFVTEDGVVVEEAK